MKGLTTDQLSRACRIFLSLAYPGGPDAIPPKKRCYWDVSADQPLDTLLPPSPSAAGICQVVKGERDCVRGYSFRLGSVVFPHLKLQVVDYNDGALQVFQVDTHDAFPRHLIDPQHPDSERLIETQKANRQLKEQIERAWEQAGLWTFTSLLRLGLEDSPADLASPA